MFVFVFEESLFVFAYATPPFAFALLFDRYTTRCLWEIHLCFSMGQRSNNNVASAPDLYAFSLRFRLRYFDKRLERCNAFRNDDFSTEGKPRPNVRTRERRIVERIRIRNTAIRIRIEVRPIHHTVG